MYQGFYVNLERNEARRARLTRHLDSIGALARYARVEAVDGRAVAHQYPTTLDPGNLGLWLTYSGLLEANRACGVHLHVLEDDAVLAKDAVYNLELILAQADALPGGWDLIFTDTHVPIHDVELFRTLSGFIKDWQRTGEMALLDLQPADFACTSSWLLNRQSLDKFTALLNGQWKLGCPIDIYLRQLVRQGVLRAFLSVPFQSSVSRDALDSDIRGKLDRSRAAATVYRRAFFQDSDLPSLAQELDELTAGVESTPLAQIYLQLLRFKVSDRWEFF